MSEIKKGYIIEEFTRFGGGQAVFEDIYPIMKSIFQELIVITDKNHSYLPKYIPKKNVVSTGFNDPKWDSPLRLILKIISLKKQLEGAKISGFSFNNHPNVFIHNSTINFGHEFFGFMIQNPSRLDRLKIGAIKKTRLFDTYKGAFFLTNGIFSERILKRTFASLGVIVGKIERIDLPTQIPENLKLEDKENTVLTFGRLSRDKNLESVIESANKMREVKFIISGRAINVDNDYIKHLKRISPENLTIIPNPDLKTKDNLFRNAKVYLHTKKNEVLPTILGIEYYSLLY